MKRKIKRYDETCRICIYLEKSRALLFDFSLFTLIVFILVLLFSPYIQPFSLLMFLLISTLAIFELLVFGSIPLLIIRDFFERRAKHSISLAIKKYLYELSKNPNIKRRNEILEYLHYNLFRFEEEFIKKHQTTIHSTYRKPSSIKNYIEFRNFEDQMISVVLNKISDLIKDSLVYGRSPKIFRELGNCFQKEDISCLIKILERETEINFKDLKDKINARKTKNKVRYFLKLLTENSNKLYYLFAIAIAIIILYLIMSGSNIPFNMQI